ncbi:hypothetical protein [Calidifontibacter terrae]
MGWVELVLVDVSLDGSVVELDVVEVDDDVVDIVDVVEVVDVGLVTDGAPPLQAANANIAAAQVPNVIALLRVVTMFLLRFDRPSGGGGPFGPTHHARATFPTNS